LRERKLYISDTLTIDSYWYYANLLSIISVEDVDSLWEMNRFVNLVSIPRGSDFLNFYHGPFRNYMVNFYECPFIDFQRINKDSSKNIFGISIIDFIKQSINEGYYALIMIDRYFIKEYGMLGFSPHQLMVHGYNDEYKTLFFCDNDATGKYSTNLKCSFASFEKAYYNLAPVGSYEFDECIYLFKPRKNNTYKFDEINVKKEIQHYLLSTPRFDPECPSPTSGIGVYNDIRQYISQILDNNVRRDIRSFHVMYDHKKSMSKRIKYMIDSSVITNEKNVLERYLEVEKRTLLCRHQVFKFFITENTTLLLNVMKHFDEIEEAEQEILNDVVMLMPKL
jgi:hypothetical protein